jgi:hypothetical protein
VHHSIEILQKSLEYCMQVGAQVVSGSRHLVRHWSCQKGEWCHFPLPHAQWSQGRCCVQIHLYSYTSTHLRADLFTTSTWDHHFKTAARPQAIMLYAPSELLIVMAILSPSAAQYPLIFFPECDCFQLRHGLTSKNLGIQPVPTPPPPSLSLSLLNHFLLTPPHTAY